MPTELTFAAAIMVGLLGSSHCIGMCGGIVAALDMGVSQGSRRQLLLLYQVSYNFGRIGSYLLVGYLAGTLGAGLAQLGVSPLAGRLFAAAFMVALGLYLANWWRGLALLERWGSKLWRHLQPLGRRLMPIENPAQAFAVGALWGWLPCGLVYAVVAWSLTTADALHGSLLMLGFGLGTLPSMLLAGNAFDYLRQRVQAPLIRTLVGVSIIGFGLYSGYTGFSHQHHEHATVIPAVLPDASAGAGRVPAMSRKLS